MGVSRRLPTALRRALLAAGVVAAAGVGLAGCDPVKGNMSTSAVAITTDKTGTRELERQHAEVDWLTCHASYVGRDRDGADSDESRDAEVDCRGQTDDDKAITIKGRVTDVTNGACVRGDLTARIGGKEWFRVDVLGNCDRAREDGDRGDGDRGDSDRKDGDRGDGDRGRGGSDQGDGGGDDKGDDDGDKGDGGDGRGIDGKSDDTGNTGNTGNTDDAEKADKAVDTESAESAGGDVKTDSTDETGKTDKSGKAGHGEPGPDPTATVTVTEHPGQEQGK